MRANKTSAEHTAGVSLRGVRFQQSRYCEINSPTSITRSQTQLAYLYGEGVGCSTVTRKLQICYRSKYEIRIVCRGISRTSAEEKLY